MIDMRSVLIGFAGATMLVLFQTTLHYYHRMCWWRREYGVACEAIAMMAAERDGAQVCEVPEPESHDAPVLPVRSLTDDEIRRLEDYAGWEARLIDDGE